MSDYLTTLARRALSPPRSIWPRPAAHFESPIAFDRPLGEPSPAPAASRVGPSGSTEPSVAGRSTRVTEAAEIGEPADTSLRTPPQKPAVSRRGLQQEEPNNLRDAHVDDADGGESRNRNEVDPGAPSDDAGPPSERVDHGSIAEPVPETEPAFAIEQTIQPAQRSDDPAGANAVKDVDGPVVDGNEDPDRESAPIASTPTPRSMSRTRLRRARAERGGEPHITVTIGRVEVTSPDRQPQPADEGIQRPALGLADYLKDRSRS